MLTLPALGQEGKGYFDHFGLEDGLSQSTVHCILQDSYGFLWIGTEDGLNRFDGYEFEIYQHNPADTNSISGNLIHTIYEDEAGFLWIGTGSGLNRYDRFNNRFNAFRFRSDDPKSISDNTVTAIAPAADGFLWIGTRNGLNLFDTEKESFRVFKSNEARDDFSISSNLINDVLIDRQQRLWCATDAGLNLFDPSDSTFLIFDYLFDDPATIPHSVVNDLTLDAAGNIWVATGGGIGRIAPQGLKVERLLQPRVPDFAGFSEAVYTLCYTAENVLWAGTHEGVICLNDSAEIVNEFSSGGAGENVISGGNVLSLIEDQGGAIWMGTNSSGIFRYSNQQQIFTHYYEHQRNSIWCLLENPAENWIAGGRNGLFQQDELSNQLNKFQVDEKDDIHPLPATVKCIVRWKDRYYVGLSQEGLLEFNEKWQLTNHFYVGGEDSSSISSNKITCLLPDSNGIWLGTNGGGLNFFDPKRHTFKRWPFGGNRNEALLDQHVTALTDDRKGNIWVGTANRGISRFSVDQQLFTHFEHLPETNSGISSGQVISLLVDSQGRLWIGTRGGGLNLLESGSDQFRVFRSSDGLTSNTITGIVEDDEGVLWVSTNSGITRIANNGKDIRRFGKADGLQQLEFLPGAAGKFKDGRLWFGSAVGVVVLHAADYEKQSYSPGVVFSKVVISAPDDNLQKSWSFFPMQNEVLEYDYGINSISIEFALLSLMQAGKNKYIYRIENMSEHWSDIGNQREITLSSPEPGFYRIQVMGANHDGVWNEKPAELQLVIHPVLWQTPAFKFLIILLLSGGIYLLYRWRVTQITARNRMLERVVKDRTREIVKERDEKAILLKEIHHRVKNNLQIIMSLLSLQSRFADDPKVESLFTESINRLQSMSMIHEKMYRSENLKEVDLKKYINELVTTLVDAYNVNREIDTDISVDVDRFAVDTLTPLGLILNELVSNALKYAFRGSDRGRLVVKLYEGVNSNFHLLIADDGVGYSAKDIREGAFGSELVEDLAEQLQGKIEKLPSEKGTTFLLTFQDIDNH